MPYPKPDDADYCPGSLTVPPDLDKTLHWHRCANCGRPIRWMKNGKLFPHVNNVKRARKRDAVQESLIFYGQNSHAQWSQTAEFQYAEPEGG